ncbi:YdcF family protein [Massilia sp. PAMC28688]|uniref:YdcF family protein n=1 Tax=Massilia sp. PAMC28688 TaxID=2861283 RepID=UPI001C635920|nr:YdcF family protein [Massilia sp. PAMC28688]QYF95238.1 YdcF family protein [Massilia sp. PAMC28688]
MQSRLIKPKLLLLALASLWICWCVYAIASFKDRDLPARSDCAIVLGAAVYGSTPSPVFEERIRHALDLYRRGLVRKLIFTGGAGPGTQYAESTVASKYAARAGVPLSDIYTETRSRTTHQNLGEALGIMRLNGFRSAIVVSDPLHLRRAKRMADDLGIEAVTSATPTTRYRSFSTQAPFLLRELYFYHHYLVTGH